MLETLLTPVETRFMIGMVLSLVSGVLIGAERESRGKDAGISTHTLVIMGSMLFTVMSTLVDPASTSRIAAQIVTGIGFLGAGLILRESSQHVRNLTTAASVWFAGAIGMAIGFEFYIPAIIATVLCIFVPRLPKIESRIKGKKYPRK